MIDRRTFLTLTGAVALAACSGSATRLAKARVLIVGGGYGGATCAKYLKLFAPELEVALIERQPAYLGCVGSNEVLAGWHGMDYLEHSHDALRSAYGIQILRGEVLRIDTGRRLVHLAGGAALTYDRLVLSPGIDFRWNALEGYDEAASTKAPHAWKAGPQTSLLKKQIEAMDDGGVVMVTAPSSPYRCPPGPYERASLMAEYFKRHKPRAKILILDAKTQFSKQALFQRGWQELYPGMVEWISSAKEGRIEHIDVDRRVVTTEFGEYRADVLNVIPPQKAGALAETAGLTDASGWCPVDPRGFQSTLAPGVHVIGDACIATPMPKSAFSANSQAKICAAAVVAVLEGRSPDLPSLINHCYSFLAPDYAISINGVYEFSAAENQLVATGGGETPMDADRRKEARFARSWRGNIDADSFS
jgi:sulfide dehydrogenase [flavocytochrome c] flavoprotein chain